MAEVTIDGIVYDTKTLSDKAKQEFTNVQAVDQEILRLNMLLAISKTARNSYVSALKAELPQTAQ